MYLWFVHVCDWIKIKQKPWTLKHIQHKIKKNWRMKKNEELWCPAFDKFNIYLLFSFVASSVLEKIIFFLYLDEKQSQTSHLLLLSFVLLWEEIILFMVSYSTVIAHSTNPKLSMLVASSPDDWLEFLQRHSCGNSAAPTCFSHFWPCHQPRDSGPLYFRSVDCKCWGPQNHSQVW